MSAVEPGVAAMLAGDGPARHYGIVVDAAADGRAVARIRVTEDMLNGNGGLHGAVLFTLADVAFACASNSRGPVTVAASATIEFLRPAGLGDELVAEAVERTRAGRSALYDVTVRRGDEVLAEVRGRATEVRAR